MPPTERRFWVVRAGSRGEDEELVLRSSVAMIGSREATFPIPSDKNAIEEKFADTHASRNPRAVSNWVGQLDTFANEIQEGDFVVLPRKGAGPVAVGTVIGPYEHREIAGELRHTRGVRWIRKDIPRDDFGADVKFLDGAMTVFRIRENSVAKRLATVLEPELDLKSDEGLRRACEQAAATLDPDRVRETAALLKEVQAASFEKRATFFRRDFTGVARKEKLLELLRKMGRSGSGKYPVQANRRILDRLIEVIGPVDPSDLDAVAERMLLGEALYRLVPLQKPISLADLMRRFRAAVKEEKLRFPEALVESLHLGLWADRQRHFAVLAGLSGTGKTQLAVQYGKALTGFEGETGGPVEVIAVQPGWHDPGRLLGYVNPLADGAYQRTEFLDFVLAASEKPETPHVLVLDEMNLSHPEQYFAPILSAMERKGGEIALHRGDAEKLGVPTGIPYPTNLVIIGTVNMDETTMGISDKVLDRAFTLEFWDIDPDEWPGWSECALGEAEKPGVRKLLADLTDALRPAQRHFGWRVIAEVAGFLELRAGDTDGKLDATAALDAVIYAKVLPKVRGEDTPQFRKCLEDTRKVLEGQNLEKCARKVKELQEDLDATGSASFWRRP